MRRSLPILLLALALAGCARVSATTRPQPGASLTLRGVLVEGVECPQLRMANGRRYSLSGLLGTFTYGDEVCVRGTVQEMSFCMAGEATILIQTIDRPGTCR